VGLVEAATATRAPSTRERVALWKHASWFDRRLHFLGIVAICGLYVLLWGIVSLAPLNLTDLDAFFLPSARIAASGHPFDIYQIRYQTIYPNANGPLSLVPLTAVAALAGHLGWLDNPPLRRMLAMATFSVFSLLLARESLLALDRLRPQPLRGGARRFTYAVLLLSPTLWHSVLFYGHIEQPLMLWLTLWAVRLLASRRAWQAGALLGLALLTRSAAVVFVVPLVLVLVRHRRWADIVRFVGAAGGTVALGLLPFWLADRADLVYSLASFRQLLPVAGGSFWRLAAGTPLLGIAQRWDGAAVLAGVVLVCAVTLLSQPSLDVTSRDLYGLLALCALCFPIFIKTLWPYYFIDSYVLLAIWWLAHARPAGPRWRRWAWWLGLLGPAAVVGCAQLAEASVIRAGNGIWDVPSTLATSAAVVSVAAGTALWLWWGDRRRLRTQEAQKGQEAGQFAI
jgi:hypothetical protein